MHKIFKVFCQFINYIIIVQLLCQGSDFETNLFKTLITNETAFPTVLVPIVFKLCPKLIFVQLLDGHSIHYF